MNWLIIWVIQKTQSVSSSRFNVIRTYVLLYVEICYKLYKRGHYKINHTVFFNLLQSYENWFRLPYNWYQGISMYWLTVYWLISSINVCYYLKKNVNNWFRFIYSTSVNPLSHIAPYHYVPLSWVLLDGTRWCPGVETLMYPLESNSQYGGRRIPLVLQEH